MELLFWFGIFIFVLGGLGFLLAAFKTNVLWGLAVLLLPPAALLYLVLHWQDAKGAFKTQLIGVAILFGTAYMQGDGINLNSIKTLTSDFSFTKSPKISTPQPQTSAPWQNQSTAPAYRCDGRIYCSQMTSCDEAKFFLRNCPGTKMDGDGNGIPCERQWCRR